MKIVNFQNKKLHSKKVFNFKFYSFLCFFSVKDILNFFNKQNTLYLDLKH